MKKRADDGCKAKIQADGKNSVPSVADEQMLVAVRCLEATQVRPHDRALVAAVVNLLLISS